MVVLWTSTVLFVNPMLDAAIHYQLLQEDRSEVLGVCAFTINLSVVIFPIIDNIVASLLANKTR